MATGTSLLLHASTDARLVELARAGDTAAFAAIVTRYRRPLLRYCARFVTPDRAEDAVQETFTNAFLALERSGEVSSVRAWLYCIAHNASVSMLRRAPAPSEQLREDHAGGEAPADVFERAERLRATVAQIRDLPDQQQRALVWQAVEGRTYETIADRLMVSTGAAQQLVHRARASLRSGLAALLPPALGLRVTRMIRRFTGRFPGGARTVAALGGVAVGASVLVVASLPATHAPVVSQRHQAIPVSVRWPATGSPVLPAAATPLLPAVTAPRHTQSSRRASAHRAAQRSRHTGHSSAGAIRRPTPHPRPAVTRHAVTPRPIAASATTPAARTRSSAPTRPTQTRSAAPSAPTHEEDHGGDSGLDNPPASPPPPQVTGSGGSGEGG